MGEKRAFLEFLQNHSEFAATEIKSYSRKSAAYLFTRAELAGRAGQ
jgi:hypothetical protein